MPEELTKPIVLPQQEEGIPDPQELQPGLTMSAEDKANIMKINLHRGRTGQPLISLGGQRQARFEDFNSVDDYWMQEYRGG